MSDNIIPFPGGDWEAAGETPAPPPPLKRPNPVRSDEVVYIGRLFTAPDGKGVQFKATSITDVKCPNCNSGKRLKRCCIGKVKGAVKWLRENEKREGKLVAEALTGWIDYAATEGWEIPPGSTVDGIAISEAAGVPPWRGFYHLDRLGYKPVARRLDAAAAAVMAEQQGAIDAQKNEARIRFLRRLADMEEAEREHLLKAEEDQELCDLYNLAVTEYGTGTPVAATLLRVIDSRFLQQCHLGNDDGTGGASDE